jgi:hypothetical protein
LAVLARGITSKRYDENVKLCKSCEIAMLRSVLESKESNGHSCAGISQELFRFEIKVDRRPAREMTTNNLVKMFRREEIVFANLVYNNALVVE